MITIAKDLIDEDIPIVSFQNTIEEAIQKMIDARIQQIVLVEEQRPEGVLFLQDLELEGNTERKIDNSLIKEKAIGINGELHILNVVGLITTNKWEVIPVLDENMSFVGCLRWERLLAVIGNMLSVNLPGAIIMLRVLPIDYSMAEIARICESNDYRIISSGIMKDQGTDALIVTLKIDRTELHGLISAFERYDYKVEAFFGDAEYRDFLKERYDLLINYLNM